MYFEKKLNLNFLIDKIWLSERGRSSEEFSYEILPDGCSDIVLELSKSKSSAFIYGTTTFNKKIHLKANTNYLGVSLRPGIEVLSNQFCPKDLINNAVEFKRDEFGFCSDIFFDSLMKVQNFNDKVMLLENILNKSDLLGIDEKMAAVLSYIHLKKGNIPISKLAKKFKLSERHIERIFKQRNGVSPKLYCRIIRFQNAIQTIKSSQNLVMSDLACSLGYSDQAHMIREFRTLSGYTPTDSFFSL